MGKTGVHIAAGPAVLQQLVKLLDGSERFAVVGTAVNGEEALAGLKETPAEIVLIDYSLPRISGVKVIEYFTAERPELIAVLLSDQTNVDFYRHGMLAGAREFIVLPVTDAELEFSLERVRQIAASRSRRRSRGLTEAAARKQGSMLLMVGAKGGSGVSFLSANLAGHISDSHRSTAVALADFSLSSGDLAAVFDLGVDKSLADLAPVVNELDTDLLKAAALGVTENLDLYPAPAQIQPGPLFTKEQIGLLIDRMRVTYDLILVDSGSHINEITSSLLEAADLVLVVVVPEVLSIRAARRIIDYVEGLGISKNRIGALINRWDYSDLPPERVAEHLGVRIEGKFPHFEEVRVLLDEGRLVPVKESSVLNAAIRELMVSLSQRLSLPEGTGVR